MKKFSESFGNISPPAVTVFSDAVFVYALGAGTFANCPVPVGASYVEVTASQFVAVSPSTVAGAPASSPSASSGSQIVKFQSAITSGTATGLNNDGTLYTATFTIDGTVFPWFSVGSSIQTFSALVASFNTLLGSAATAAIVSGQIVVTSATTGVASKVSITSAPVVTPTPSPTPSITVTSSATTTPTLTATPSLTHSITPSVTITPTLTPSVTDSPGTTRTPTPTATVSNTPTNTTTPSITPSATPTISHTPTVTPTITVTISVSPTVTTSKSVTPTISVTPSQVGSGVFSALTLFAGFATPVNGALITTAAEVVLRTVKQFGTDVTTIGVYAYTSGTNVSLAFYK